MDFPVGAEDVRIAHGHAGRGLQVVCSCGCVNMNYFEAHEPTWGCRNCGRIFTHDFPHLVEKVLALQQETAVAPLGSTES